MRRGLGISDPQRNTAAGMQDAGRRAGGASCGSDGSSLERSHPAASAPLPACKPWQEPVAASPAALDLPSCHAPGLPAAAAQVAGERALPPGGHSCEVQGAVRRLCNALVARLVGVLQPAGAPGHAARTWTSCADPELLCLCQGTVPHWVALTIMFSQVLGSELGSLPLHALSQHRSLHIA